MYSLIIHDKSIEILCSSLCGYSGLCLCVYLFSVVMCLFIDWIVLIHDMYLTLNLFRYVLLLF